MGESPSRPIQQRSTTGLFVVGHPEPYGKSRGLLLELLNGMTSGETARPRGLPGLALAGQGILNSGGLYRPEENGSGNLAENSKSSSLTLGVVHWSNYRLLDTEWSASVAPSRPRLVSSIRTRRPFRLAPRVRAQLRRRLAPSTAAETDPSRALFQANHCRRFRPVPLLSQAMESNRWNPTLRLRPNSSRVAAAAAERQYLDCFDGVSLAHGCFCRPHSPTRSRPPPENHIRGRRPRYPHGRPVPSVRHPVGWPRQNRGCAANGLAFRAFRREATPQGVCALAEGSHGRWNHGAGS